MAKKRKRSRSLAGGQQYHEISMGVDMRDIEAFLKGASTALAFNECRKAMRTVLKAEQLIGSALQNELDSGTNDRHSAMAIQAYRQNALGLMEKVLDCECQSRSKR